MSPAHKAQFKVVTGVPYPLAAAAMFTAVVAAGFCFTLALVAF